MTRWILPTIALSSAALGLAACGSSGSTSGKGSSSGSSPGIVAVKSVDGSKVLTTAAGRTLYTTPTEKGGQIHCMASCTSIWSPLQGSQAQAMSAANQLGLKLASIKRPDGLPQLTLNGLPVYTFAMEGAGKLSGDGASDEFQGTHFTWQAARTNGGSAPASTTSRSTYGY
jgi:predicted lipoprotein with Yx(FWY)xxD motif